METILIFDTETNGVPVDYKSTPLYRLDYWPEPLSVAANLYTVEGEKLMSHYSLLTLKDSKYDDPKYSHPKKGGKASDVHGIPEAHVRAGTTVKMHKQNLLQVSWLMAQADVWAGHNIEFDIKILLGAIAREFGIDKAEKMDARRREKKVVDTMTSTTEICKIPQAHSYYNNGSSYKWPKLEELYDYLFSRPFEGAHNAAGDVAATAECLFELQKRKLIAI